MNWTRFWLAWIVVGVVAEGIALLLRSQGSTGATLTEFSRKFLLVQPVGAAILGAFLFWMIWHWLFDTAKLGPEDLFAALAGAAVGVGGWIIRKRSLVAQPDEHGPPKAEDAGSNPVEGTRMQFVPRIQPGTTEYTAEDARKVIDSLRYDPNKPL